MGKNLLEIQNLMAQLLVECDGFVLNEEEQRSVEDSAKYSKAEKAIVDEGERALYRHFLIAFMDTAEKLYTTGNESFYHIDRWIELFKDIIGLVSEKKTFNSLLSRLEKFREDEETAYAYACREGEVF